MAKKEGATALMNMGGGITLEQAEAFYANIFNSKEINKIYEQEVSKKLSQKELEEIVMFFRSDLGKKYIETNLIISRIIAEKSTVNMNNIFNNE